MAAGMCNVRCAVCMPHRLAAHGTRFHSCNQSLSHSMKSKGAMDQQGQGLNCLLPSPCPTIPHLMSGRRRHHSAGARQGDHAQNSVGASTTA